MDTQIQELQRQIDELKVKLDHQGGIQDKMVKSNFILEKDLQFSTGRKIFMSAGKIVTDISTGLQIGSLSTEKVGFLGATPVGQTGAGAATASSVWGSTEQSMLQKCYDKFRALGFFT